MLKCYQRTRGANYTLRGTVAGVRIYESTGTNRRALADAYRARREAEILERHTYGRATTTTFAQAALSYMRAGGEARFLRQLLEYFGPEARLTDIDNAAVFACAEALHGRSAPATINRCVITPISAVYNFAADDGLCERRRFRRRKGDNRRLRWLTPQEADALIEGAARHILPAIALMLGGGCRSSEALSLEAATYYQATGEAYITRSKNGDGRMIALPRRAQALLEAGGLPEAGPLCRTPKGQAYIMRENGGGQISGAFRKACDRAGLGPDVTPHVLRHTWATWYYAQTRDFGGLMDRGGWRKADMANRYRKIAPADLADRLIAHGWDFGARAAPRFDHARLVSR